VLFWDRIPEGLRYYLLTLTLTFALVLGASFVYAAVTGMFFFAAFRWVLLGAVFLMFLMGLAGLLPFSEYHFGDPFNPAAKREQAKAVMKGRESKAGTLAFVFVGFTLLLTYLLLFPY